MLSPDDEFGIGGVGVEARRMPSGVDADDMFDDDEPEKEAVLKGMEKSIPLLRNGWGSHGLFRLVGNSEVTNPNTCGKFACLKGCLRVDLHDKITLDGKNYRGKVFVRRIMMSCGKPSCPKCFKSGWAVREAGNIEARLNEAKKNFGLVEHIICSVPSVDYGLSHKALRRKGTKIVRSLGVIGGVLIFHAFRYDLRKGWFFSPHWHILGFILGGYSRCRHCKGADCYACDGFDGRTYKLYRKSGYIVRVMGKRKTVFGTAWYQLHHASYKVGGKRNVVATWFGCCSYRKLKVTVEMRKDVCPICQHDIVNIDYFGCRRLYLSKERDSFEDLVEDGRAVFVEKVNRWAVARKNRITDDDYVHFPKSDLIDKLFPKSCWGSVWSLGKRGVVDGS